VDGPPAPYNPNAAPSKQFGNPVLCAQLAKDGLVYVCDTENDRIQVFKKDGSFVREKVVAPATRGTGSVWDIAFSRDPQQKYLYVADGMNMKVHILDRQSLEELTSFGDGGRQPGQFYAVHSVATDSKGNIYTAETYEGKRVQKFNYKGVGPIVRLNRGVVWPTIARTKP
jgi:DNA-binding beta-propeller fold protein YncE